MFKSLKKKYGKGKEGTNHREDLDKLHQRLNALIKRQSERDFPRGLEHNGIIDRTKCRSTERVGNLFGLLCLAHTIAGKKALNYVWKKIGTNAKQFCNFIMLYLAMEA